MLGVIVSIILAYEIIGFGFVMYSLGLDEKTDRWTFASVKTQFNETPRPWGVWFKLSQYSVPIVIIFTLLYVVNKASGQDPYQE